MLKYARCWWLWLTVGLALATSCASAGGPSAISYGGTTMVPMRLVFEWFGATVTASGSRIQAAAAGKTVVLTVGSRTALVNGARLAMTVAPIQRSGVTYVPLRFVAQSFGATVSYRSREAEAVVEYGGRVLRLKVAGADPVSEAIAVFQAYLLSSQRSASHYGPRAKVFFSPRQHDWLMAQREEHGEPVCPDVYPAREDWPLSDPRFVALLEGLGWKYGDLWFPYATKMTSATSARVTFSEWNWWTTVIVQQSGGVWRAVAVEEDGEGNEAGRPLRRDVVPTNNGWRFPKAR